jgi:thioredoxin 1
VINGGVIFLKYFTMIEINESNFDEVISSNQLVLVDFWATWCGPCKSLEPVLKRFSEENENIFVGKIDVSKNPNLLKKYDVSSVPTLLLFKNNEQVVRHTGFINATNLKDLINKFS